MKNSVYADHAATTPLLPEALEAMLPWLKEGFGNPSSLHSFGREARKAVEVARLTIAECIGARPEEIFFTSGGTEADNWVIRGTEGTLVVSEYEHHAVLNAARGEARRGRKVFAVRPSRRGIVGARQLKATLDTISRAGCQCRGISPDESPRPYNAGLVSIMAAQNEIGTINPVRALSAEAHSRGFLFHADAVQAIGKIPVDVRDWDVDFLSASAHKFGGPKGVGFLYSKDGKAPNRLLDGGAQESGVRAGTENVAGIVGMSAALQTSCERMEDSAATLHLLSAELAVGLCDLFPSAGVIGPSKPFERIPGFIAVAIPGHPAEGMLHILDLKGIAVSAGAACNSTETVPSHVLKAIGLTNAEARSTLRISLGPENTQVDVKRILSVFRVIRTDFQP